MNAVGQIENKTQQWIAKTASDNNRSASQLGDMGLDRTPVTICKINNLQIPSNPSGADSGAVGASVGAMDSDLALLVAAWPSLPDTTKANILAMVKAATSQP